MPHKKPFVVIVVLLLLITIVQYSFSFSPGAVSAYSRCIFYPFQYLRNNLFSIVPVSVGDILYILASIVLIVLLGRWIYYLAKWKTHRQLLLRSLLRFFLSAGIMYLWFFAGWGGNYAKPSLAEHWQMPLGRDLEQDSALIQFDLFLIARLEEYAPRFRGRPFRETEQLCRDNYYHIPTTAAKARLTRIKPAVFGNLLEYSGIQGYYNPFTGEGQLNAQLPDFLSPFVISHEMAHQMGIAAEQDANLLAYIACTESGDADFRYSAYLNVWLYTNGKLRGRDSTLANEMRARLNPVSRRHLEVLRARHRKYRSPVSRLSNLFYDNFLKLNQQERGLESYEDVVNTAYAWEQKRLRGDRSPGSIP